MGSEIDLAIESILSKDVDLSSASDLGTISKNSTFDDVVMGFHNHHHHTSLETDQDFSFFHHNTQNACRSLDFQRQTAQSHKFLYSDNVAKNSASFLPLSGNSSDFESNFMTSSSHISLTSMDSTTSNAVASATQILPPLFNSTTIEGGSVTAADDFFAMDICSQTYPLLSSAAITLGDDSPVKNTQADVAVNLQRRPLPPAAPPAKNAGQQIDNLLVEFINLNFIDEAILEVVFDVHRWAKCGLMFLLNKSVDKNLDKSDRYKIKGVGVGSDIFDESSNGPSTSGATTGGPNGTVKPPKFTQQADCICPECGQPTAACRFAPHLEKCMGMGRNSSRVARRRLAAVCSSSSLSSLTRGNKNADVQQQQQNVTTRSSIHVSNSASKLRSMPKNTTTKRTRAKIWIEEEGEDEDAEESDGILNHNLINNDNNHGSLDGEDSNSSANQPRGGMYEDDDDWSNTSGGGVNSRKKNRQKKNFTPKTSRRRLKVDTSFKRKQACLSEERFNEDTSLLSDFLGCTQYSQTSNTNDLSVNTHYLGHHDLSEMQDVPSPSL